MRTQAGWPDREQGPKREESYITLACSFSFDLSSSLLREMQDFLMTRCFHSMSENVAELYQLAAPVELPRFVALASVLTAEMLQSAGVVPEEPPETWRLASANRDNLSKFLSIRALLQKDRAFRRLEGHVRGRLAPFDDPEFQEQIARQSPATHPAFCLSVLSLACRLARVTWMSYRCAELAQEQSALGAAVDWNAVRDSLLRQAGGRNGAASRSLQGLAQNIIDRYRQAE